MDRKEVYALIDGERTYQDALWNENTTTSKGLHSPEEWLLYMRHSINKAEEILASEANQTGRPKAMNIIRKIAAMGVAAIEQNGCGPREVGAKRA